ncbi:MAG: hypothetical protein Q8R96_11690 [Bacteroidota bacterium]|nr:hypothetical protein [Bacteroidota bacterium]
MKSNKKVLMIGAGILLALGLLVWYLGREKTTPVISGNITTAADIETNRHITEAIDYIKSNTEWYNNIVSSATAAGLTVNQAVAYHAIWAVKTSGKVPMAFGGSGEWGHKEYVKANF